MEAGKRRPRLTKGGRELEVGKISVSYLGESERFEDRYLTKKFFTWLVSETRKLSSYSVVYLEQNSIIIYTGRVEKRLDDTPLRVGVVLAAGGVNADTGGTYT